jgi:hypothetical protein
MLLTAAAYTCVVVICTIAVMPKDKTHGIECHKPYIELLIQNTDYLGIRFSQVYNNWVIDIESKDERFETSLRNPVLCEGLHDAWYEIQNYEAYVAKHIKE